MVDVARRTEDGLLDPPHDHHFYIDGSRDKHVVMDTTVLSTDAHRLAQMPDLVLDEVGNIPIEYEFDRLSTWWKNLQGEGSRIGSFFRAFCMGEETRVVAWQTLGETFKNAPEYWAEHRRIDIIEGWKELFESTAYIYHPEMEALHPEVLWVVTILDTHDFESRMTMTVALMSYIYESLELDSLQESDHSVVWLEDVLVRARDMSDSEEVRGKLMILYGLSGYYFGLIEKEREILKLKYRGLIGEGRPVEGFANASSPVVDLYLSSILDLADRVGGRIAI